MAPSGRSVWMMGPGFLGLRGGWTPARASRQGRAGPPCPSRPALYPVRVTLWGPIAGTCFHYFSVGLPWVLPFPGGGAFTSPTRTEPFPSPLPIPVEGRKWEPPLCPFVGAVASLEVWRLGGGREQQMWPSLGWRRSAALQTCAEHRLMCQPFCPALVALLPKGCGWVHGGAGRAGARQMGRARPGTQAVQQVQFRRGLGRLLGGGVLRGSP